VRSYMGGWINIVFCLMRVQRQDQSRKHCGQPARVPHWVATVTFPVS
jgi:hypothetical protein